MRDSEINLNKQKESLKKTTEQNKKQNAALETSLTKLDQVENKLIEIIREMVDLEEQIDSALIILSSSI